ncbi:MAG: hypothetical protein HOU81_05630 [Hamadaea sp.]|uniref:hypothetical protein n=1 Tax=Hamadaea sp. TaxID=2024425 RepID=UPI00183EA4A6|nr:hypothetical protein [Hamadaea sp.]NUR70279.1 hypothetical protein [Hamadaea sp.]NUT22371.1 hypothetical protein [Hamadaea sp.]
MRHLWSLIAGVVIAPLVWAVVAFGQTVMGEVYTAGAPTGYSSKVLLGAGLLVGAGLIAGLIASLRVSPVGPLLVALLYLGSSALLIFAPKTGADVFDRVQKDVLGHDVMTITPLKSGVIPVLGGVLLIAVFSASRWRVWPGTVAADSATTTTSIDWTATPVPAASESTTTTEPTTSFTPVSPAGTGTETSSSSPWGPTPGR